MSNIEYDDKIKRNVEIGYLQKNNPEIAYYIHNSIHHLIDFYLDKNSISKDDVIIRAKDGLILRKSMKYTSETMPISFRGIISKMIISIDRKKYLCIKDNDVVVKGVSKKPVDISFYNMFKSIDFSNKKSIVHSLEQMRKVIFSSEKCYWFCYEDEDGLMVPIKGTGYIKIKKTIIDQIDIDDIDKRIIWEEYMWPFCAPLLMYCT